MHCFGQGCPPKWDGRGLSSRLPPSCWPSNSGLTGWLKVSFLGEAETAIRVSVRNGFADMRLSRSDSPSGACYLLFNDFCLPIKKLQIYLVLNLHCVGASSNCLEMFFLTFKERWENIFKIFSMYSKFYKLFHSYCFTLEDLFIYFFEDSLYLLNEAQNLINQLLRRNKILEKVN